jgi:cytochrome c-type biogenesis protein
MVNVTIIAAFFAGIISFLSPCILPLIPGFLAYLSGVTIKDSNNARLKIFMNSVFYVLGFTTIFSGFGILLNTVLEHVAYDLQTWMARIGGTIIIFLGLYNMKLFNIPFLDTEHKFNIKKFDNSYFTSFLFGAAFAVGWTPCVGAVLGSVLALAVTNPSLSFILLVAYSLGLGLPFMIVGLFTEKAMNYIKKLGKFMKYFNYFVGILLIILGILIFTQTLNQVANLIPLGELILG